MAISLTVTLGEEHTWPPWPRHRPRSSYKTPPRLVLGFPLLLAPPPAASSTARHPPSRTPWPGGARALLRRSKLTADSFFLHAHRDSVSRPPRAGSRPVRPPLPRLFHGAELHHDHRVLESSPSRLRPPRLVLRDLEAERGLGETGQLFASCFQLWGERKSC